LNKNLLYKKTRSIKETFEELAERLIIKNDKKKKYLFMELANFYGNGYYDFIKKENEN